MEQKQSYSLEEVATIAEHFARVAIEKHKFFMSTGSGDAQRIAPDLLEQLSNYSENVPKNIQKKLKRFVNVEELVERYCKPYIQD